MTFEGRNLYGHTYNHNAVFSQSKHHAWRPPHHELAFGKATTRPPWYRSAPCGGASELPPADAGRRYEPQSAPADLSGPSSGGAGAGDMLHHFTGESRHQLAHSSNTVKGAHEDGVVGSYNTALAYQGAESRRLRHANTMVHNGSEGRALVRRDNTNASLQPLYPMSVVNDSFKKHLEAKAIDRSKPPKPELAQHVHLTQKMYLPYERTRSHFPATSGGGPMHALAQQQGPGWWPGRDAGPLRVGDPPRPSPISKGAAAAGSAGSMAGSTGGGQSAAAGGSHASRPTATPRGFMHDATSGQPLHAPGYFY